MMEDIKDPEVALLDPTQIPSKGKVLGICLMMCVTTMASFILLGMFVDSPEVVLIKDVLHFKNKLGEAVIEEISRNEEMETSLYTMHAVERQMSVFKDFKKKLAVVAVRNNGEDPHCLVYFLNASKPTQRESEEEREGWNVVTTWLQPDSEPVEDTSFLPIIARKLCYGIHVFWASQRYGQMQVMTDVNMRTKRELSGSSESVSRFAGTKCVENFLCEDIYEVFMVTNK